MIVCIAEKPSVGRDIARILGANVKCDGYMEGNGYQVTWTFGHLCELKEPHEYFPQWKQWSLAQLPMIPPRFGIKLKADELEVYHKLPDEEFRTADFVHIAGEIGITSRTASRMLGKFANKYRIVIPKKAKGHYQKAKLQAD